MHKVIYAALLALCLATLPAFAQTQAPISEDTVRTLLESALRQHVDASSQLSVSVIGVSQTPEGMVINDVTITGAPVVIQGLRAEIFAQLTSVQLDPAVQAGTAPSQVRVRSVGRALITVNATAAAIRDALAARFPLLESPTLSFSGGQFLATGRVKDLGQMATLRGRFIVERGQTVRIVVHEAKVGGGDIPPGLVQQQLEKINPVLDLSTSPIPLRVRLLALHNDRLEMLLGTD